MKAVSRATRSAPHPKSTFAAGDMRILEPFGSETPIRMTLIGHFALHLFV